MNTRLTVSTWNFKHLDAWADPTAVIAQIRRMGYAPELWLHWDERLDCFDRPRWSELAKLIGPCPDLSFHTRNQPERLVEELDMLAALGGRVLVVHPIALCLPEYRRERPERHPDVPLIRDLASEARRRGVFIGLENIFSREFQDRTLEAVETFDEHGGLGICIDLGHAEMRRDYPNETPVDLIRDFGPVLLHLHVHDVAGERDHQPLGSGRMDYAAIAAALREANFDGTAVLEIQAPDPIATIEDGWKRLKALTGEELTR